MQNIHAVHLVSLQQMPASQYPTPVLCRASQGLVPFNLTSHPRPSVVSTMGSDPKGRSPYPLPAPTSNAPQEPWERRPFAPPATSGTDR